MIVGLWLLQALRGKRSVEQMYEDAQSRINELTTINVNMASQRAKLEQELSSVAADYEEVTKELRVTTPLHNPNMTQPFCQQPSLSTFI